MKHKVKFKKWNCIVRKSNYFDNGRIALSLVDKDGDEVATATVNLPDEQIGEDEVFIKDYSENEGILKALQEAKIVGPVIESVSTGFVSVQKCKLLI